MTRAVAVHVLACVGAAAVLAACSRGGRDDALLVARECWREQGDSAVAVCAALNTHERVKHTRAKVDYFVRRGDTLCVITSPADGIPRIDGQTAVEIVDGSLGRIVTDSVSCGGG